ncbi:MAG: RNA polymerase sigma factor [Acidimicrobiales bacterium]
MKLDEDEAHALASDVLLVALEKFRTRSLPRWRPSGGASLRSYFIGRCLMELADVYAAWHDRELRPLPIDGTYVDDGRYDVRPDEQAEAKVLTDQLLDRDPDLYRVLQLQDEGYTLEEIATRMGRTRAAVRSQLYRGRLRSGKEDLE